MLPAVVLCALAAAIAVVVPASARPADQRPAGTDFFPDWVPFKNKRGEDLGEFVQVPRAKLKKRLALPVNFILKAVAEPDGDDYLEKGGGPAADNEDYFEKKEWSDELRQPLPETPAAPANHTLLSDIDGVVDIITKKPDEALPEPEPLRPDEEPNANDDRRQQREGSKEDFKREELTKDEDNADENKDEEETKDDTKEGPFTKPEDDGDDDEIDSEKLKSENKEQSENEAKKAIILSSVDELKERHAAEQRLISEKVKEEELFKEERERDGRLHSLNNDKYGNRHMLKHIEPDYEEEEERDSSTEKRPTQRARTDPSPTRTAQPGSKAKDNGKEKGKDSGNVSKYSVFKSPQLYLDYEEERASSASTTETTSAASVDIDEGERISLLPASGDDPSAPALFFPKKTKGKHRKPKRPPAADSYVAETVAGKTNAEQVTSAASIDATAATATDADAQPASTAHHKEEPKVEDYENERGGGRDYHSQHEEDHEEHGKKAYEGLHKDTKTAKGHHDKENHHGEYHDHAGVDKQHHDEAGHYGAHHHEEHGKKHAKYEESGKHAKGHSTKGSHDVHKKEEYEKKVEFFEEEGDSGDEERHGGFHNEREHKEGGHFKKGGLASGHHEHAKGESGHFQKGGHEHAHQGHAASGGHDEHGRRGHREHQKAGRDSDKKWVYHHGHPAGKARLAPPEPHSEPYVRGAFYYFG